MTRNCRIVAIGEVLWDVFPDSRRLGGAPLNFAAHAARLGHPVRLIGGVGDDALGHSALEAIRAAGLDPRFVETVPALPTGVARVTLGPNGQTAFRIERPAAYDAVSLSAGDCAEIAAWSPQWLYHGTLFAHREQCRLKLNRLASALPRVHRFYDVNLRPGCFSTDLVLELLARADVVKLNEVEMASVAAHTGLPKSNMERFCAEGAARFAWQAVAVTLGVRGCAVWRRGEYVQAPGREVRVADTVGAGDGFAAAMLHGVCRGWPARAIADFANRLGSLIASRPGGIPDWTVDELRTPPA
jgi:fructokinase